MKRLFARRCTSYVFLALLFPHGLIASLPVELSAQGGIDSGDCVLGQELALGTNGKPLWLGEKEVMARVERRVPVETPGLFHGHLKGAVKLEILIDAKGELKCARIIDGNPIAFQAVLNAVTKWTFRPYEVKGKAKAVLARLTVEYEFGRQRN